MPGRDLQLDHTYEGQFEVVGQAADGTVSFESVQKLDTSVLPAGLDPDLEINTVKWSVDPTGKLTGTAKFLLASTYDLVSATLEGYTPNPPPGQDYRDAIVNVTFSGGTRVCNGACGTAQVAAKLYNDGRSRGVITGLVQLPTHP
jgi:hypothetical protein